MKNLILTICLLFSILQAKSQAPAIEWQKCYGGSKNDGFNENYLANMRITQTSDGGYIMAGFTYSNDGDVTENHGNGDFFVVKTNNIGAIQWKKTLGGTGVDNPKSIIQTTDGGYAIAGYTTSNDGDVSGYHGGYDMWIVKLSSTGNILWQKTLGGTYDDSATSIIQTTDGGFAIAGYTTSNDGDVSGNHGSYDMWIVKLSSTGNILWQKTLGGTSEEELKSIIQTTDGGFVIAGYTKSNNGDVSGNHGSYDMWIVKLNNTGNILWQKTLGGTDAEIALSIIQTTDGGFAISGNTISTNGDVTGNHGNSDMWVVKLNSMGNILWQKTLGGTDFEIALSIIQTTDEGFGITGYTSSNDGDVTGNHGNYDFWVVKLTCETPTPPTTATANPTNVNTGQTSALSASGCASGNTYLWKKGSATVATTASFTTPPLGTTTIYTAYCVNGSCVSSGINVTVDITQVPFSISPSNQLAICQNSSTITAVGCAGTVNWYRDTNGAGTAYVSLGTSNPLTYLINADLTQFIRATCTVGLSTSDYSNYAIIRTGPNITPQSYIIKAGGSKILTASGCPAGTTYLWETGETTATVTKSPNTPPSQYPTVYNVKCVSQTCQSPNGFAYIYVGEIEANDDTYVVNIGTPLSENISTNDAPMASKVIQIDPYPSHGNLVFDNTGTFTYTPNTGYTGTDFFEYYLLSGSALSNYARVSFNIICPTNLSFSSTNTPTDDINSGIVSRQASYVNGTISATNKITTTGTKVTYQAKNIQLNAGFKADNGTVFIAEVGGCL